jgi:hypothetical protein
MDIWGCSTHPCCRVWAGKNHSCRSNSGRLRCYIVWTRPRDRLAQGTYYLGNSACGSPLSSWYLIYGFFPSSFCISSSFRGAWESFGLCSEPIWGGTHEQGKNPLPQTNLQKSLKRSNGQAYLGGLRSDQVPSKGLFDNSSNSGTFELSMANHQYSQNPLYLLSAHQVLQMLVQIQALPCRRLLSEGHLPAA